MTRCYHVFLAIIVFLLIVAPENSQALWPHYPDESLLISPSRSNPRLSPDGEGGAILTWVDGQVFAQRVSAEGKFLWGETGIRLCSESSSQSFCDIFGDGTGGALAVWKDSRNSPLQSIYAQRIDQDGNLLWGSAGVLVVTMDDSISRLRTVTDGAGGLVVTWNVFRSDDEGSWYAIYGQRLNFLGEQLWGPAGVSVGSSLIYSDQLAADGQGGGYVLCLTQTGGYTAGIFAKRILGNGELAWDFWNGLIVSSYSLGGVLASDGNGGCLVGYYRRDYNSEYWGISVKRLNGDGESLWDYGAGITSSKEWLDVPVIFPTEDHGALVGWSERISGRSQAFAQKISPTGEKLWNSSGVAVCSATTDQDIMAVQPHDFGVMQPIEPGGAVILWEDDRSGSPGIYAQGLEPTGLVKWSSTGVPVITATPFYYDGTSTSDDDGGAILALRNDSNSLYDIFSQRLNRRGTLGALEPVAVEIDDVPEDEGGWMQIRWYGSAGDVVPDSDIARYGLWRFREGMEDWELTGEIPATGQEFYEAMIPTLADSVFGSTNWHDFRVSATTSDEQETFYSATVSGYSIDNVGPAASEGFEAHFSEVEAIAPNPFNPRTVITYQVAERQPVSLKIYDARGRMVRRLLEEPREAGRYRVAWDGCDESGSPLPSGVYCCRLQSGGKISMKKMTLIR